MRVNVCGWIGYIERMSTALILLTVLFALTLFWLDSARAREIATTLAKELCDRRGLQFLDETVVLSRIGVGWRGNGLRFRRMFNFDFSRGAGDRRSGYLILLGTEIEQYGVDLPDEGTIIDQTPDKHRSEEEAQDKVVPFRRPPKK